MYCPTCTTTPLVLAQRQKVEVDYCPHCRGVWLDRGELEKILDGAASSSGGPAGSLNEDDGPQSPRALTDGRRPKHRKSWLSEIFD